MSSGIQVVWFKRDLRARDHAPLYEAALRGGRVLPLYIVEPILLLAPDFDSCHWAFIRECLLDLRDTLPSLVVRAGEAVDVFTTLHREHGIERIWSHEETGNGLTYARDRAVARWARMSNVEWNEIPSGGVVRRLRSRDGWSRIWEQRMAEAIVPSAPTATTPLSNIAPGPIPTLQDLGLASSGRTLAQPGGESQAHALLDSFLNGRGYRYHQQMSSPVTAFDACSRLSPHLAYGTISTRQVVQALRARIRNTSDPEVRKALRAFDARLHWRDHFMQKLEDEPAVEFENFVRGFDGLRDTNADTDRLEAWKHGRTGYPMIDACMRCLHQTGWINFRMRAMLMSFAAYHLWLHWREPGLHLARLFVDYEPGIHWSQCQMQSGTTGINTLRIYNPTKQAEDHDPDGVFLKRWLPELRDMPAHAIATPWKYPLLLNGYPTPIVDHAEAVRHARARLAQFRRDPNVRAQIAEVAGKHGSRKSGTRHSPRRA